jgi:hypothetical protein
MPTPTGSTNTDNTSRNATSNRDPNFNRTPPPTGFKLGRLARTHDPRIPKLQSLLKGKSLPTPAVQVDYTQNMPSSLGVMGNDTLGDCTCAAFYHALQVWTYNAEKRIETEPDIDVVDLYEQACGYNPSQGGEGPGGNEQHVLTYVLNKGAPVGPNGSRRQKLSGFVEVDVKNINYIKSVIQDCGVAYIGFNVPQYIVPPGQAPPAVWDLDPSADNRIVGGHAVVLAGYNSTGARVISWGQYYTMTWAFFERFVDEAYALIDEDWVNSTGKTPAGLSMQQLTQAMQALRQN